MRPASEVERRRLNDLFAELCAIPSPFGRERAVAERVAGDLRALGYEVNNFLRRRLEAEGLVISGTSPDERLVEIIEIADHPFFVASQFHPEFKSRPERPAPLFRDFVGAAFEHAGRFQRQS